MAIDVLQELRRITENGNDEIAPMTSVQKAAWVERQIRQVTLGNLDSIVCPYCGLSVVLGVDELCCKPMNDVATVLLDRMESTGSGVKDGEESPEEVATNPAANRNRSDLIQ